MTWPARLLWWALLALPSALLLRRLADPAVLPMDLLDPSGIWAVRLIVLALLPGPLAEVFGAGPLLRRWLAVRRHLGVAGFAYAACHLALYFADLGGLAPALDELGLPGIWTGWLALALLAVPAALSSDAAMRALARRWKQGQRLAYAALAVGIAHWLLLAAWALRLHHRFRVSPANRSIV